jgi:hypothetical protein
MRAACCVLRGRSGAGLGRPGACYDVYLHHTGTIMAWGDGHPPSNGQNYWKINFGQQAIEYEVFVQILTS